MLLHILKNAGKTSWQLGAIITLTFLEAGLASASITMVIPIIESLTSTGGNSIWLIKYLPQSVLDKPGLLLAFFGLIVVGKSIVSTVRSVWSIRLAENLRAKWQIEMARKLIAQPYLAFSGTKRGKLLSNLTQQTDTGAMFIFSYLDYFANLMIAVFIAAVMTIVDWRIMLLLLVVGGVGWFVFGRPYFRWSSRLGKRAITLHQAVLAEMTECFSAIKDIKVLNADSVKLRAIGKFVELNRRNRMFRKLAQILPPRGAEFALGLLLLITITSIDNDPESLRSWIPLLAFFAVGLQRLVSLAATLASQRFKVLAGLPSYTLVTQQLLTEQLDTEDLDGGLDIDRLKTSIRFRDIHFKYPESQRSEAPVLKGVDLTIQLGKVICLFGPSGAGKTTVLDLLVGLYQPDSGRIEANGHEISEFKLRQWRELVGYVGQEPILFHGTLEENIRLGDKKIDAAAVRRACDLACATEFIEELPDGLQTVIGEQGGGLSGGQRRRIALARALARNVSIVVLDETTSALQEDLEGELLAKLRTIPDLSVIIITHRLASASLADQCFLLEGGRIKELSSSDVSAGTSRSPVQD